MIGKYITSVCRLLLLGSADRSLITHICINEIIYANYTYLHND